MSRAAAVTASWLGPLLVLAACADFGPNPVGVADAPRLPAPAMLDASARRDRENDRPVFGSSNIEFCSGREFVSRIHIRHTPAASVEYEVAWFTDCATEHDTREVLIARLRGLFQQHQAVFGRAKVLSVSYNGDSLTGTRMPIPGAVAWPDSTDLIAVDPPRSSPSDAGRDDALLKIDLTISLLLKALDATGEIDIRPGPPEQWMAQIPDKTPLQKSDMEVVLGAADARSSAQFGLRMGETFLSVAGGSFDFDKTTRLILGVGIEISVKRGQSVCQFGVSGRTGLDATKERRIEASAGCNY